MEKLNFAEAAALLLQGNIITDGKDFYRMTCGRLAKCQKDGEYITGEVIFNDMDLYSWYLHRIPYSFDQAMRRMYLGEIMWFGSRAYRVSQKDRVLRYEDCGDTETAIITYEMATREWYDVDTKE